MPDHRTQILIIMGVSGSGKTTIGRRVAERLGWRYFEGDDYHPVENVAKMSAGIPLQDNDRWPWLARIRDLLRDCLLRGQHAVVTCSALKASYREYLLIDPAIKLVYLHGDHALLYARMRKRRGHYMKAGMLESQFAALEEPAQALSIDVARPLQECVEVIVAHTQSK